MQKEMTAAELANIVGNRLGLSAGDSWESVLNAFEEMQHRLKNTDELDKTLRFFGWEMVPLCSGCGSCLTDGELHSLKAVACCPERKMIAKLVPPGYRDLKRLERENKAAKIERTGIYTPKDMDLALKDLVSSFAGVLAERLHKKHSEYGNAWKKRDWQKELSEKLHRANDPITAAAFAAFAWSHGWLIDPPDVVQNINIELTVNPEPGNVNVVTRIRDDILAQDVKALKTAPVDIGFHQHRHPDPDWAFYQQIADFDVVDAALRELVDDTTADNGVRVVKTIFEALRVCGKIKPEPCAHSSWEECGGGGRRCADCGESI